MLIPRTYSDLSKFLHDNKVLLIYGPRQVGKTTLLNEYLKKCTMKFKLDSGDNIRVQHLFSSNDFEQIKRYAEGYELIAIDEAQRIPHVGQGLKILVDQVPHLKVIATGSSSFSLSGEVGEPLAGRKITLNLFPIAQQELSKIYNQYEMKEKLEQSLLYGGYPEVVTSEKVQEKERILEELVNSYLLKDIMDVERVKGSKVLLDLLRLVAFQVGNEVSLSELAKHLGIDGKTAGRYLDLFEKSFIIYNLRGFSKNLREEIVNKSKYYFYDNGIRNAIISNFNRLELRNDIGLLWENFMFMERMKKRVYTGTSANIYFWRTWDQKEIDLIEERDGKLFAFEFKWKKGRVSAPKKWRVAYPESEFEVITSDNYLQFII
jgi:predicted AAA+ superfamily ATPase